MSREKSRAIYEAGTEFQIGKIEMVTNTGTYLDCPFHRYADGKDLSQILPEPFADLEGIVIRHDLDKGLAIDVADFRNHDVRQCFENHPFLTADTAAYLCE